MAQPNPFDRSHDVAAVDGSCGVDGDDDVAAGAAARTYGDDCGGCCCCRTAVAAAGDDSDLTKSGNTHTHTDTNTQDTHRQTLKETGGGKEKSVRDGQELMGRTRLQELLIELQLTVKKVFDVCVGVCVD